MKSIFVTGGTGLLGHHLLKTAPRKYNLSCTFFPLDKKGSIPYRCAKYHIDITNDKQVSDVIELIKPAYVIHTASMADVDYVERNKEEARRTNLGGTANVISACRKTGAALVYISSNAVFNGRRAPYSEDDPVSPINYYGELKAMEEEMVKKSGLKYAIVRAILMYGWNLDVERENSATWIIKALGSKKPVNMVDDIFCNPLFVEDCAALIWKIILLERRGIFHVAGKDEVSRYEFACAIAEIFGLDKNLITPVKNSFFNSIAPRPKNTSYSTRKIEKELMIFPIGIKEGLKKMKEDRDAST